MKQKHLLLNKSKDKIINNTWIKLVNKELKYSDSRLSLDCVEIETLDKDRVLWKVKVVDEGCFMSPGRR